MENISMQDRLLRMQATLQERNKAMRVQDVSRQATRVMEQEAIRCREIKKIIDTIPENYRGKVFSDFKIDYPEQAVVKKVAEFVTVTFSERMRDSTAIKFIGHSGTGKTMLSLLMFQAVVKQGFTACYQPSLDFLRVIQEKKFVSNSAYLSELNLYKQPQLLIIDEATEGSGRDCLLTSWEQKLLFNIIDWRQQNKRCSLLISNRTNEFFTRRLGNPIADRLHENGVTLTFTWESYRKNKRK
jgi:DNA replication protein DnaC